MCPPSILCPGRRSFGLMAEAVLAGRECTRDAGECWMFQLFAQPHAIFVAHVAAYVKCAAAGSRVALRARHGGAARNSVATAWLPLGAPSRPADWGVLRLTLINFSPPPTTAGQPAREGSAAAAGGGVGRGGAGARGAAAEVSFLVERTEGDAMRLRWVACIMWASPLTH